LRGGSWIARYQLCQPAFRLSDEPHLKQNCYGFRVVLEISPPEGR
jgi:formylglycine-generating enzyme required for sulfatase activity